jgi:hypothetical protein
LFTFHFHSTAALWKSFFSSLVVDSFVSSGETTPSALGFGAFFLACLDKSLLSVSKIGRLVAADDLAADEVSLDLGLVAAFRAESSLGLDAMGFTLVLEVEGFGN